MRVGTALRPLAARGDSILFCNGVFRVVLRANLSSSAPKQWAVAGRKEGGAGSGLGRCGKVLEIGVRVWTSPLPSHLQPGLFSV